MLLQHYKSISTSIWHFVIVANRHVAVSESLVLLSVDVHLCVTKPFLTGKQ